MWVVVHELVRRPLDCVPSAQVSPLKLIKGLCAHQKVLLLQLGPLQPSAHTGIKADIHMVASVDVESCLLRIYFPLEIPCFYARFLSHAAEGGGLRHRLCFCALNNCEAWCVADWAHGIPLKHGYNKGCCLSRPCTGHTHHVLTTQSQWQGLPLYWGGQLVPLPLDCTYHSLTEPHRFCTKGRDI